MPDPHVAVLAFPFGTHAAPLFAVVRRLAAAAPRARFSFFSTAASNASFLAVAGDCNGGVKLYDVWDGAPEGRPGRPHEAIELFLTAARGEFTRSVEAAVAETGRGVSCVVSDAFLWFAAEIAAELRVPWVAFWTSSPQALCAHLYTDAIREHNVNEGDEGETLDFIPGLRGVRVRDLPEGIAAAGDGGSVFAATLHQAAQTLPRAAMVFVNSSQELDPPATSALKSKLNAVLNVGPLNMNQRIEPPPPQDPDPHGCIPWLQAHTPASVVYVSFGSVVLPSPDDLAAVAGALEASGVPFLWSLRDSARARLPEGFPDGASGKGMVVPWAPQVEVLTSSAVGAFVTHGGWNSVLEGVAGGVPMICRPFFGDQRLNARMVAEVWEIGVGMEGGAFTKEAVVRNLEEVLMGEQGKKMRKNVRELREMVDKAVGEDGNSTKDYRTLSEIVVVQNGSDFRS